MIFTNFSTVNSKNPNTVHKRKFWQYCDKSDWEVDPEICELPVAGVDREENEDGGEDDQEFSCSCVQNLVVNLLPEGQLGVDTVVVDEWRALDPVEAEVGDDTVENIEESPRGRC